MLAFKILRVFFIQVSTKRGKKKSHSSIQWTVFEMGVLVCSRQLSAPNRNTHLTAELNWSLEECNGGKGSALAN